MRFGLFRPLKWFHLGVLLFDVSADPRNSVVKIALFRRFLVSPYVHLPAGREFLAWADRISMGVQKSRRARQMIGSQGEEIEWSA